MYVRTSGLHLESCARGYLPQSLGGAKVHLGWANTPSRPPPPPPPPLNAAQYMLYPVLQLYLNACIQHVRIWTVNGNLFTCTTPFMNTFTDDEDASEESLRTMLANLKERNQELEDELRLERNRGNVYRVYA